MYGRAEGGLRKRLNDSNGSLAWIYTLLRSQLLHVRNAEWNMPSSVSCSCPSYSKLSVSRYYLAYCQKLKEKSNKTIKLNEWILELIFYPCLCRSKNSCSDITLLKVGNQECSARALYNGCLLSIYINTWHWHYNTTMKNSYPGCCHNSAGLDWSYIGLKY